MPSEIPADIAIETVYIVEATYTPEAAARRPAVRTQHLAHIGKLRDAGVIVEAGGHLDLSTALLMVRAASADEAVALFRDDVYTTAGVWTDLRAKPYGRVVRPAELEGR
jgi:uncharacterized protein